LSPEYFEPNYPNRHEQIRVHLPAANSRGEIELARVPREKNNTAFAVPTARFWLEFTSGASAIQKQRCMLRPLAEHPGTPQPPAWDFWFTR
jgi:hypothetical protein